MLDCDVVVVGSGAGGAPMAAELAEAGYDVIVLEEGSYYQTRDFTANTSAMVRQLYREGGATMALGDPPILYQEGRTVGGSTVINGGMSWRTPDEILRAGTTEAGLDVSPTRSSRTSSGSRSDPRRADGSRAIGNDNLLLKKGADAKGWEIIGEHAQPGPLRGLEPLRVRLPDRREADRARQLHPARAALRRAGLRRRPGRADHHHGKRATGVIGHVGRADGARPGGRGAREAWSVGVRRDPHARPARALGRPVAVGHARQEPVACTPT